MKNGRHTVDLWKRLRLKAPAVVTGALLLCGVLQAQGSARKPSDDSDEKLLEIGPYAAKTQADQFIEFYLDDLYKRAMMTDAKAGHLADKIREGRKRQDTWEISAWSLSNSSLLPGESIDLELGNGVVSVKGTVKAAISRGLPIPPSPLAPDDKIIYMVNAPPEIRSRILMEGLRHDLNNFAALLQFDGKSAGSDGLWVSWKSAWFDAQEVFCKYNPGAKFTDLNAEEQTCKASTGTRNKSQD